MIDSHEFLDRAEDSVLFWPDSFSVRGRGLGTRLGWLLNNVPVILWGAYHMCAWALLVCVLCQAVHYACTEPALHALDFFLEIFLRRLVSVLF